jgi:hypothetical protein
MTSDRRPPLDHNDDLTEAVQRIVPRRHLIVRDGDILIMRVAGGFRGAGRLLYELSIHGMGPTADKFASFEHAAVRGEQLAITRKVRLFYFEEKNGAPFLLKDARA